MLRNPAFIGEHNRKTFHKPGKQTHVADALSRQHICALENENTSKLAIAHSETLISYTLKTSDKTINCFGSQLIIEKAKITYHTQFYTQTRCGERRRSKCNLLPNTHFSAHST